MFTTTIRRSVLRLCLVLALVWLACPASAAESEPTKISDPSVSYAAISPDSRWIVFIRDGALWSVPAIGGAPVLLNNKPSGNGAILLSTIRLSTNSRWVLFGVAENDGVRLYSVPIGGGLRAQLDTGLPANSNARLLDISSDSVHAMFSLSTSVQPELGLYSVRIDGSGRPTKLSKQFASDQGLGAALLSPDGQWVAYEERGITDSNNNQRTLYSVPITGGTPLELEGPAPSPNYQFLFTPDSSRIVYRHGTTASPRAEIRVIPVGGGQPQILDIPAGYAGTTKFLVSPDSKRVVYAATSGGSVGDLLSAPLSGDPALKIGTNVVAFGIDRPFRIAPDGQRVVFTFAGHDENNNYAANLYSVPITGGNPTRLDLPGGAVGPYFYIAPDSKRVVYMSYDLYSAPIDGSSPAIKISAPLEPGLEGSGSLAIAPDQVEFTPDNQSVVYLPKRSNGANDLFIASLFKQEARKLNGTINHVGERNPNEQTINFRLSPNGAYVVFRGAPDIYASSALYTFTLIPPNRVFVPLSRK